MNKKPEVKAILAKNLKTLMDDRKYNQSELARKSKRYGGISQKTISNILSQEHSATVEHLDTLGSIFGISPALLVSDGLEIKKQITVYKSDRLSVHERIEAMPASWIDEVELALDVIESRRKVKGPAAKLDLKQKT